MFLRQSKLVLTCEKHRKKGSNATILNNMTTINYTEFSLPVLLLPRCYGKLELTNQVRLWLKAVYHIMESPNGQYLVPGINKSNIYVYYQRRA